MSAQAEPAHVERPYSDVVHTFEPNSLTFPALGPYVRDLVARRTFIRELAGAEVRGQRSSTFMGELWSLMDPMFQAAIYLFLFTTIRASSGRSIDFVTTLIGSVFLFNFTRISVGDGGRAILKNKGLVLNAVFPRALLPIAEVYKGFLATLPALAVYVVLHLAMRAPITQAILLVPLVIAILAVINLGLALLFATATAYFSDVSHLMPYILRLLTFTTPVIYPVALLTPTLKAILSINPLFALFSAWQGIITGQMPSVGLIFQAMVWATVLLIAGVWVFLRHERSFALRV